MKIKPSFLITGLLITIMGTVVYAAASSSGGIDLDKESVVVTAVPAPSRTATLFPTYTPAPIVAVEADGQKTEVGQDLDSTKTASSIVVSGDDSGLTTLGEREKPTSRATPIGGGQINAGYPPRSKD